MKNLTNEKGYAEGYLNDEEALSIHTLLSREGITTDIVLEAPVTRVEAATGIDTIGGTASLGRWSYKPGALLVLEQKGKCRLSAETRLMEEQWLASVQSKSRGLRTRKRYTRKRGTVHPKKKEATRRRTRMKNWAKEPFHVLLARDRRKCKSIDKELWYKLVQPLWIKYDPRYLTIDFPSGAGTRVNPYTLWNMTIKHKNEVVWKGEDEHLYYLSGAGSVPSQS